jgi:hypothetical protein
MSRKPKTPPVPLTREEKIAKAIETFTSFHTPNEDLIATPTRSFEIGESVVLGGLKNPTICQKISDKIYVVQHGVENESFMCDWWTSIDKRSPANTTSGDPLFKPYLRGQLLTSGMNSILHYYTSSGIVCDPTLQREYVWTQADQISLLDSIFERLEIGSFCFVRNNGYLHKGKNKVKTYRTLEGKDITIPCEKDYTMSIIDGQQRLTTIINFWLNKIRYKGMYFSDFPFSDQAEFTNTSVQYRIVDEENITREEVLKMFLQVNRGVPQTSEHLDKVRMLYFNEVQERRRVDALRAVYKI